MRMKRFARVFTTSMLAGAMVMTMGGMTAFAAVDSIPLTKTVTTDGNTYAPNTTFNFTVEAGEAGVVTGTEYGAADDSSTLPVMAGVNVDKVFGMPGGYKFAPGDQAEEVYTLEKNIEIKAKDGEEENFPAPGIYHYLIKETAGNYEGIIYDTVARDIYLYVGYADGSDELEVQNVVVSKNGQKVGNETTIGDRGIEFINNYGKQEPDPENPDGPDVGDTTHDLTVTKKVAGNQGDKNKPFDFTVKVNGAEGECYKVIVTYKNQNPQEFKLESGDVGATYSLKDGESIQIFGLTANDTYTVTEADYSKDGYTVDKGNETGSVTEDATKYEVTNTKNVTTPTGIVLSFAPYIMLVALAGVFAVLFLRKKKEEF